MKAISIPLSRIALLLLLLLPSCQQEPLLPPPHAGDRVEVLPDGRLRVPLNLLLPSYHRVETRTVANRFDEDRITSIWVVVFESPNGNVGDLPADAQLLQLVRGEINDNDNEESHGRGSVILNPIDTPCRIRVIANLCTEMRERLDGFTAADETDNPAEISTFDEFEQFTITLHGFYKTYTEPGGGAENRNPPYTMSSEAHYLERLGVAEVGSLGDVELYMAAARIDVNTTEVAANFALTNVTLLNGATGAYLRRHTNLPVNLDSDGNENSATIPYLPVAVDPAENTPNIIAPIYLFTNNGALNGQAQGTNATYIVVHGKNGNHAAGYYKLAIRYLKPSETDYCYDINRNTLYTVKVKRVEGPGYLTLSEAAANTAQNIEYSVEVTDGHSHDLVIANGEYYMGLSNSEFVVYGDGDLTTVVATTLTHNAPSTVTTGTVTATGGITFGSGETTASININPTPTIPAPEQKQEISINIPDGVNSGSITLRLGNLIKNIAITRRSALTVYPQVVSDFASDEYVFGTKEEGGGDTDWLRFSPDSHGSNTSDEIHNPYNGGIYLVTTRYEHGQTITHRSCDVYLSRRTSEGRVRVHVRQNSFSDYRFNRSYAGAFWRNNQTGERLIRIVVPAAPNAGSESVGNWTAQVIWKDDRWNPMESDIVLDVLDLPTYPAIAGAGTDAELRQVNNSTLTTVSGYAQAAGSPNQEVNPGTPIYFRIGLKSQYTPTEQYPARYAIVLLRYSNNTRTQHLYLRQGEGDDYLMQPGDAVGPGGVSTDRSYAVRFSPFNLTAPQAAWDTHDGQGDVVTAHPQLVLSSASSGYKGEFVYYPSQAGALFQWATPDGYTQMNRAYRHLPLGALKVGSANNGDDNDQWYYRSDGTPGYWTARPDYPDISFSTTQELCPPGYRRPSDRRPDDITGHDVSKSEVRQSLFYSPKDTEISSDLDTRANSVWGYYADGYFDRRAVNTQGSQINGTALGGGGTRTAVSFSEADNEHLAAIGRLFFNPTNGASLFFPAGGLRGTSGDKGMTGDYASYWLGSSIDIKAGCRLNCTYSSSVSSDITTGQAYVNSEDRDYAMSVRCVRED